MNDVQARAEELQRRVAEISRRYQAGEFATLAEAKELEAAMEQAYLATTQAEIIKSWEKLPELFAAQLAAQQRILERMERDKQAQENRDAQRQGNVS